MSVQLKCKRGRATPSKGRSGVLLTTEYVKDHSALAEAMADERAGEASVSAYRVTLATDLSPSSLIAGRTRKKQTGAGRHNKKLSHFMMLSTNDSDLDAPVASGNNDDTGWDGREIQPVGAGLDRRMPGHGQPRLLELSRLRPFS